MGEKEMSESGNENLVSNVESEENETNIENENAKIRFYVDPENKKIWNIFCNDIETPVTLNLVSSTTTNKFYIVAGWIQNLSEFFGEEFDAWFWDFINRYENSPLNYDIKDIIEVTNQENNKFEIISNEVEKIKDFVDRYIEGKNFDFAQFVNTKKMKKNKIIFTESDVKQIITVSGYLKIYAIISNSKTSSLPTYLHKKIYNKFVDEFSQSDIVKKIYNICRTKTYRYNMTDKYMWEYLREKQSRDPESYIIETFNFLMSHILTLCKPDRNPITYFVTVVDSGLKWFLRTRYDSYISYSELSSTEDIQSINFDNVKTHSYNMVLNRVREIAKATINAKIEAENPIIDDDYCSENKFDSAMTTHGNILMSKLNHVSPIHEFLTFPIFSAITEIPYIHFKVVSKSMGSILSLYLHELLKNIFPGQFSTLFKLLDFYVDREKNKSVSISTTYTLKDHEVWNKVNQYQNFCSFNSRYMEVKIIEYFIGVLSSCKYRNLYTDDMLGSISVRSLEADCIEFYPAFYAGFLNDKFDELRMIINKAF